jgi:hypothetical protein
VLNTIYGKGKDFLFSFYEKPTDHLGQYAEKCSEDKLLSKETPRKATSVHSFVIVQ